MQTSNAISLSCIGGRLWFAHVVALPSLVVMLQLVSCVLLMSCNLRFFATDNTIDANAAPIVYCGIFPAALAGLLLTRTLTNMLIVSVAAIGLFVGGWRFLWAARSSQLSDTIEEDGLLHDVYESGFYYELDVVQSPRWQ